MIKYENVNKEYENGVEALKSININIDQGEFVFIVGNTGSGKSSLIRLLLKELEPTSGNIYVDNKNLSEMKEKEIPFYRRKIGCIFQDFKLLNDLNAYENIAFAQHILSKSDKEIKKNVLKALTLVDLLNKNKCLPKQLSGGEKQKVAIARAIINSPDILLADEPTGNLDPKSSIEIINLLEKINQQGTTVIVITHDQEIVNLMKKRVITMKKGIIVNDEYNAGYDVHEI